MLGCAMRGSGWLEVAVRTTFAGTSFISSHHSGPALTAQTEYSDFMHTRQSAALLPNNQTTGREIGLLSVKSFGE